MSSPRFPIGSLVVKNPDRWTLYPDFDAWGRGIGVGLVVEPPFPLRDDEVDVLWPAGRCFEWAEGLLPRPADDPRQGPINVQAGRWGSLTWDLPALDQAELDNSR